jgi:hypothetical protein
MREDDGHVHLPMWPAPTFFEETPPTPPRVRGDCLEGGVNEFRPCPWTGCKWNIVEAQHPQATCVLDIADQGGITLEELGQMMGLTRERIRQIEEGALGKLKKRDRDFLRTYLQT